MSPTKDEKDTSQKSQGGDQKDKNEQEKANEAQGDAAPLYGQRTDEPFVGVSPEYQNFASDTDKPLLAPEDTPSGARERLGAMVQERNAKDADKVGMTGTTYGGEEMEGRFKDSEGDFAKQRKAIAKADQKAVEQERKAAEKDKG